MEKEKQNKKWHALYVSSRSEKKVMEILLDKGIEAYVPLVRSMRQWSDRKKMVSLPLFNGYVFVNVLPEEKEKVVQSKGVVSFVRSEGKVAVIKEHEIERLKQLVRLGYQLEVTGIKKNYKEGDKVKINSGALKGIEGFVLESREGRFIEILLESIGQSIKVKLPEEILLPL
ncbi:MAG: UpxY family transcription antiterminator [Bacteroidia bacterium]